MLFKNEPFEFTFDVRPNGAVKKGNDTIMFTNEEEEFFLAEKPRRIAGAVGRRPNLLNGEPIFG